MTFLTPATSWTRLQSVCDRVGLFFQGKLIATAR
jgi:hypothetical protein